jgi:hypothetical protein
MKLIRDKIRFIKNFKRLSFLLGKWIVVIVAIKLYGTDDLQLENLIKSGLFIIIVSLAFGGICSLYVEYKDDKI